ncbi:hypothetical protein KC845_00725 [Candidatus Kaiserbacteria bacterium]|nr:hypothetical protein [Candidatus Kaiserbacteria bacterium]
MTSKNLEKPNFKDREEKGLPKLGKIETNWNLKKHFYKSDKDPQIKQDELDYQKAIAKFRKEFYGKQFTTSTEKLLKALTKYENLINKFQADKILRYFSFRSTLNVNDDVANKMLAQYSEKFRTLSNDLLFFKLELGKIPKKQQKIYLADPKLADYRYFLSTLFKNAEHHLSEPEEKILTLRANTSAEMWYEAVEKIISNRDIKFKGKTIKIPEALEMISLLKWHEKDKLWNLILDELIQISEVAEHELTAIVNHEKVSDKLRGFKKPYSASILSNENSESSVEALVDTITKEGFKLSRRFYKLKAKIHNQKTIPYVNRYDPIGKLPNPTFLDSVEICRDTFYSVKSDYGEIFDRLLKNGQVDVYPKKGKRGGAFMAGTLNLPTFVMLNHTNDLKSQATLAHEMGHAVHAERSKGQRAIYESFSTTTAETASTLFEQLVLDRIFERLSNKDKVIFLHDKLNRDIATVQRQIACFNFELEMHNHIRENGVATKTELATMMNKHLKAYLGEAVSLTEKDGYFYVAWHHIRYGFYVYTYTYGHLISNLMAQNYQKDKNYVNQIDKFLCSGGVDNVDNIFKSIGINTKSNQTFLHSLKTQDRELKTLESLLKNK